MAVITLSRQFGCNGEAVAQGLAERFGFRLIDHAGLDDLVLSYGLDEGDLEAMYLADHEKLAAEFERERASFCHEEGSVR